MTRIISENTPLRTQKDLSWRDDQLERRPAPGVSCAEWLYVGDTDQPPFQNSWINFGGDMQTLRFRLQSCDLEIEGTVTGGTPPSVVFTLPLGFRPDATLFIPGVDETPSFIAWQIDATGEVKRL